MTGINELQSRIGQYGLTHPNRFQVDLAPPTALQPLIPALMKERLAIQCETAQLPGKSFSTKEQRIYGPVRKFPYTATYTSTIDLTFRVGVDFVERSIFDAWQDIVMNSKTNMFGYYNTYVTDLFVHQFDREDQRIYSVKLIEAWPEAIQPIELSASTNNTYNRQTITFAYRQWEVTNAQPLVFTSTTTEKKAEGGRIVTVLKQAGFAFFDQLPLITGSGGTIFGSVL
jgi:hypothetical protein